MPKAESLYHTYPDYRVDLEPSASRVRVFVGDQEIADSRRTLLVKETERDPVVYFPRDDVRMDLFERTRHQTFCPFKGHASYWTVRAGDLLEENAVWTYEEPFEEVLGLKDYVSFYVGRGEISQKIDSK